MAQGRNPKRSNLSHRRRLLLRALTHLKKSIGANLYLTVVCSWRCKNCDLRTGSKCTQDQLDNGQQRFSLFFLCFFFVFFFVFSLFFLCFGVCCLIVCFFFPLSLSFFSILKT